MPRNHVGTGSALHFDPPSCIIADGIKERGETEMKSVNIRLSLAENVKAFVNLVNRYPYDVDLRAGRHHHQKRK